MTFFRDLLGLEKSMTFTRDLSVLKKFTFRDSSGLVTATFTRDSSGLKKLTFRDSSGLVTATFTGDSSGLKKLTSGSTLEKSSYMAFFIGQRKANLLT